MLEGTISPTDERQFRILIKSVGTARPLACAAVAQGLGLPASTVVSRLYRAPAILVDGIDELIAKRMASLLSDIGYEAEVQDTTTPAPAPSSLYDVAIDIKDTRQFQDVVQKLAAFVGISESDATRMILTPPAVVLGSVSNATVHAFSEQMGPNVSVLSSRPDTANYDLFLSEDSGVVHKRILTDIASAGLKTCGTSGLVASHVDHATAKQIWQRHQASGLLRVVNQDFLRFDIVLQQSIENETLDTKQIEALERLAGVPADMTEEVLLAAPITLLESVPKAEVAQQLASFAEAGLTVRADLITFQTLGLEVLSLTNPVSLMQVLEGFGLYKPGQPLPRPPFRLPGVLPELQARIIRTALEDTGAQITFVEVS